MEFRTCEDGVHVPHSLQPGSPSVLSMPDSDREDDSFDNKETAMSNREG